MIEHIHIEPAHYHEDIMGDDGVRALHAEDAYLTLAGLACRTDRPLDDLDPRYKAFDIESIEARLGEAAPELSEKQRESVRAGLAMQYDSLPRREVDDHHGHEHGGCGTRHGPIQKMMEKLEHSATHRAKSQRAKIVVALAFRAGLFTMCPGDDIAAIGLQVYSSIAGSPAGHQEEEHGHGEVYATLTGRPRPASFINGRRVELPTMPIPDPKA